jgi:hypothetical protein
MSYYIIYYIIIYTAMIQTKTDAHGTDTDTPHQTPGTTYRAIHLQATGAHARAPRISDIRYIRYMTADRVEGGAPWSRWQRKWIFI